jgi:hypothetical protein
LFFPETLSCLQRRFWQAQEKQPILAWAPQLEMASTQPSRLVGIRQLMELVWHFHDGPQITLLLGLFKRKRSRHMAQVNKAQIVRFVRESANRECGQAVLLCGPC